MIGITYHKDFNKYDLGLGHPLVGDKPKKTIEILKQKGLLEKIDLFKPEKAEEKDLLRVHAKEYVDKVKRLSKTGGMLAFDTPAPKGIYDISRIPVGGTLLGGEKLFKNYNMMTNPLGGFHHAGKNSSSGFCFFNDIAIVIEKLREEYNLKKFLIVDLDVHHGNGTQEIYSSDPSVLNLSIHQNGNTLYPGTGSLEFIGKDKGKGYTVNLPITPGTGTESYKTAFDEIVPSIAKQFKPEIIIYQSGVDTHHSDPLADINLTYQAFYYLSSQMKNLSKETCNKLLVLFGGGYNSKSIVISYYNIMCGLLDCKKYIKEHDRFSHKKFEVTKNLVSNLKRMLKPYWSL